jgi:mannose-6-phosphate isomerase-like protein (cupin superfamily)
MKHIRLGTIRKQFGLLLASRSVQAVKMTLPPGEESDDDVSNEHPRAEQWMLVTAGSGTVIAGPSQQRRRIRIGRHSLLLIAKGEPHQIRNTGRTDLTTINFYVPPAYRRNGKPRTSIQK